MFCITISLIYSLELTVFVVSHIIDHNLVLLLFQLIIHWLFEIFFVQLGCLYVLYIEFIWLFASLILDEFHGRYTDLNWVFWIGPAMEISRKYGWMVQKGKGRRIWIFFLFLVQSHSSTSARGCHFLWWGEGYGFFFLFLVRTPGGLVIKLVLPGLLVGLFSIGVLPRLVTLISSEFALQTSTSFPVFSSSLNMNAYVVRCLPLLYRLLYI